MIPQDLDKEFGIVSACVIHCLYLDVANKNSRELLPKCPPPPPPTAARAELPIRY